MNGGSHRAGLVSATRSSGRTTTTGVVTGLGVPDPSACRSVWTRARAGSQYLRSFTSLPSRFGRVAARRVSDDSGHRATASRQGARQGGAPRRFRPRRRPGGGATPSGHARSGGHRWRHAAHRLAGCSDPKGTGTLRTHSNPARSGTDFGGIPPTPRGVPLVALQAILRPRFLPERVENRPERAREPFPVGLGRVFRLVLQARRGTPSSFAVVRDAKDHEAGEPAETAW